VNVGASPVRNRPSGPRVAGSAPFRSQPVFVFRRDDNTALAGANVNVRTAMRLAVHRNASTHMLYVMRTGRIAMPSAALPSLRI
jgi:hypothetical protein